MNQLPPSIPARACWCRLVTTSCFVLFATATTSFGDPLPHRATGTNVQEIVQTGITNSTLIVAGNIIDDLREINSPFTASDVEVLRVFKSPPGFHSNRVFVGYLIGKYDAGCVFFTEKPRTNTFILFLNPGTAWKGWYDVSEPDHPFLEATKENVRLLQAALPAPEPLVPNQAVGMIILVATGAFTSAALGLAVFFWMRLRKGGAQALPPG